MTRTEHKLKEAYAPRVESQLLGAQLNSATAGSDKLVNLGNTMATRSQPTYARLGICCTRKELQEAAARSQSPGGGTITPPDDIDMVSDPPDIDELLRSLDEQGVAHRNAVLQESSPSENKSTRIGTTLSVRVDMTHKHQQDLSAHATPHDALLRPQLFNGRIACNTRRRKRTAHTGVRIGEAGDLGPDSSGASQTPLGPAPCTVAREASWRTCVSTGLTLPVVTRTAADCCFPLRPSSSHTERRIDPLTRLFQHNCTAPGRG